MYTEATEAHFFAQESSSTHRMNSDPVSRTQFLWKKVSLRGFGRCSSFPDGSEVVFLCEKCTFDKSCRFYVGFLLHTVQGIEYTSIQQFLWQSVVHQGFHRDFLDAKLRLLN